MEFYTREQIIQRVEEEDVEFIRLQFTDMFGVLKNIAVPVSRLMKALDNQCVINAAYIPGLEGEAERDFYLYPDLSTFTILPWRPQQGKVARLICDIYNIDRTVCENSSRAILKRVIKKARDMSSWSTRNVNFSCSTLTRTGCRPILLMRRPDTWIQRPWIWGKMPAGILS